MELNKKMINEIQKIIEINNDIIIKAITLIKKNNLLYENYSPLEVEKKTKELNLLQRKRESEKYKLEFNNNHLFKKQNNFSIPKENKIMENISQYYKIRNVRNDLQPYPINYKANNYEKWFCDSASNSNQKQNNEIQIINDASLHNNPSTKLKFWNIKKKINEKNIFDLDNNNEIKVLKNNKIVYMNTYLRNSNSTSKAINKLKKITFIKINKRGSKYRGVSRNGNNWQVFNFYNLFN